MAEGKKAFVLYADLIHTVSKLSDLKAGKLLKIILDYVNDKNPDDPKDLVLSVAFEPIRQQLKRDLKIYELRAQRSRQNGSLGGRPKGTKKPKKPSGLIDNPEKPRKPDIVTVKDTVTVTVKDKGKVKENNNPLSHFGTKNFEILKEIDEEWQYRMKEKYNIEDLDFEMKKFCGHLFDLGEVSKTVKDFKSHYVNLKNKRPNFLSNGTGNKIDWEKV